MKYVIEESIPVFDLFPHFIEIDWLYKNLICVDEIILTHKCQKICEESVKYV